MAGSVLYMNREPIDGRQVAGRLFARPWLSDTQVAEPVVPAESVSRWLAVTPTPEEWLRIPQLGGGQERVIRMLVRQPVGATPGDVSWQFVAESSDAGYGMAPIPPMPPADVRTDSDDGARAAQRVTDAATWYVAVPPNADAIRLSSSSHVHLSLDLADAAQVRRMYRRTNDVTPQFAVEIPSSEPSMWSSMTLDPDVQNTALLRASRPLYRLREELAAGGGADDPAVGLGADVGTSDSDPGSVRAVAPVGNRILRRKSSNLTKPGPLRRSSQALCGAHPWRGVPMSVDSRQALDLETVEDIAVVYVQESGDGAMQPASLEVLVDGGPSGASPLMHPVGRVSVKGMAPGSRTLEARIRSASDHGAGWRIYANRVPSAEVTQTHLRLRSVPGADVDEWVVFEIDKPGSEAITLNLSAYFEGAEASVEVEAEIDGGVAVDSLLLGPASLPHSGVYIALR
ncbi:hypothetical protein FJZ36_15710 [Candidatus Poribacteria bacterium]|nr:hypothetical protein [Candidatus Poribacteria bacterium]